MFLLPLQPLPGAPSVVSPESSGLLDIGTGFRDMLQNAQQHLGAEGAPDVPMPERPVLAALMADLLAGDAPSESEDSPKQIVSVLVPETPLAEGDAVVPFDQELPVANAVSNTPEGMLTEVDEDAFSQVGRALTNAQDVSEGTGSEKPPVFVAASDQQVAAPKLDGHPTVQPVLSEESLAPEPSVQPRKDAPAPQLQSLPTSSSELADAPLPVFGQIETPVVEARPVQENAKTEQVQESDLGDADQSEPLVVSLPKGEPDIPTHGEAPLPLQTGQEAQAPVPGLVAEQTTTHRPAVEIINQEQNFQSSNGQQNLNDSNGQQNPNDQNQVVYASAPLSEGSSDAPVDGVVRPQQPISEGDSETRIPVQTPLQQVEREGVPLQSGDVQIAEDQPAVVQKPTLETPEQTPVPNRTSSGAGVAVPLPQVDTEVENQNPLPTPPQAAPVERTQRVVPVTPQTSERVSAVLPKSPEVASAPLQENVARRDGITAAQTPTEQPVLQQGVSLTSGAVDAQNTGAQQATPILQGDGVAEAAVPVTRPSVFVGRESAQPMVARQDMPLTASVETQANVSGQVAQTRPEMATLLSGEHNEVAQIPPSVTPRSTSVDGVVTQQPQMVSSESDILPQPPVNMTNAQNISGGQASKPLETVSQPVTQAPAPSETVSRPVMQTPVPSETVSQPTVASAELEGLDDDQAILPRHPSEVVHTAKSETPRSSEIQPLNRPEVTTNLGAQTLDRSGMVSSSEAQPLNRSEFVAPLAADVVLGAPEEIQGGSLRRPVETQFAQQAQPIQRDVTPTRVDVQTPIAQPQQPVVQDAAVTQQVQAVAAEEEVQRSVERPVTNGVASAETAESRVFVAPEAQLNGDTNRDQRAPSQQAFVAPQAVSEQPPPVAFEEVVEQEILMPNMDQNVDLETQSIDRIPGRPEMRVDMMAQTTRATSTSDIPQGQLNAMPSEEIDQQYRVGEQIIRNARVMTREGATQVTMRLDPQELGEVTIRLSTQDQVVSGEIAVESQKVQEIVQRNMGVLREALASQGIQLENIDVSVNDRGAQPDRETFRESLEERSGEGEEQEQTRSDSDRWEQNEQQQKQTSDGQVDFVA